MRLDYAKAAPSAARRKWRRVVLTSVLLGLVVGGWAGFKRFYPAFQERRLLAGAYTRCASFAPGPEELVYGEEADTAGMQAREARVWDLGYTSWGATTEIGRNPRMRTISFAAQPWITVAGMLGLRGAGTGSTPSATVFCHERRSTKGEPRLVTVSVSTWDRSQMIFHGVGVGSAVEFGTATVGPIPRFGGRPAVWQGVTRLGAWPDAGTRVRFFAGQAHPTDESRFTIAYSIGGAGGSIDGRLLDDGTVELGVRDGPLGR
jgi:hypothetical protein